MKKLLSVLLAAALVLGLHVSASAARVVRTNQRFVANGQTVDCEIYNIDGSNYFKLRDLAQLMSGTDSRFSVSYDAGTGTVSLVTGESYVPVGGELAPGEDRSASAVKSPQTLLLNGGAVSPEAWNIGGSNFFKLRDLGRLLGFSVRYDEASRTAYADSLPTRLAATEDAGRDYLDKLVFLGDSTTYGIGYYYRRGYTSLVPASQVWTPKSGTLTLSYYDTAKIVYPATGEELSIPEAAGRAKPAYLVITLGVNGVSFMDKDWFIRDYTALVRSIQAASPETRIILNSIYPVADSYEYIKSINNSKITTANGWVESIARDTGCRFLYSFESVAEKGKLPESAHNGDGLHLSGESFGKVMEYIRKHAWQ